MKRMKRFIAFGAVMLLLIVLIACSSADKENDAPAGVQHTIAFAAPAASGEVADEVTEMVTRSPRLVHTESGEEYELQILSSGVGTAVYTFETAEEIVDLNGFEVTAPVQYVEESAEEVITIPLSGSSDLVQVEVSDSLEKFPNADRGVLVEFTSSDVESVPYNLVLVSGGEVYDNCSVTYKFDNETGDFTGGQRIYFGVTMEELSPDAYLEASSMFNRYVLSDFSLAE